MTCTTDGDLIRTCCCKESVVDATSEITGVGGVICVPRY